MTKVFISYAWKDGSEAAHWLYKRFNQLEGWSAWMDRELHAHSVFSAELQRRINEADMVVVVLTPDINRLNPPSFVQLELGYATQPEVKKPVYAVKALSTMVPLIIWGVTFIDFQEPSNYESAFHGLIGKITHGTVDGMLSRRDRELAYLRDLARDEINRRTAKFYAELPAQAKTRIDAVTQGMVEDDEAASILAELAADIHTKPRHSPDDDPNAYRVEDFDQLSDALSKYPRVAIIGDPGSGKTTTLRRLTYLLAETAAQDEAAPLPVYVPLGGYDGSDFAAYIDTYFGSLHIRDYLATHPERLIILLDGLNETAHTHVDVIKTWLKANPKVSVRLTCRKLDYVERELELQRVDVQPLDHQRIWQFIAAYRLSEIAQMRLFWKLAGENMHLLWEKFQKANLTFQDFFTGKPLESGHPVYFKTNTQEDQLYNQMRKAGEYPSLLGLARNPFLLTITISIYTSQGDIPRNRAGLFRAFVQKLLKERGRPAAQQQGLVWLDEAVLETALSRLAYEMQAQGRGTSVPYEWARDIVAHAVPGHDASHVLYLCASAGIIDRGRELRFVHQLLQEYFAAFGMKKAMEQGVPAAHFFPSNEWWMPTGWEETAVLMAGMTEDATKVVEWLTPVQPDLAYKVSTESGADCAKVALQALYEPADGARRSPYVVSEWGRLNHENDQRPGVGVVDVKVPLPEGEGFRVRALPDLAWCDVPAGTFLYGKDKHGYKLPHAFKIAKYPVTMRQFQAFIDSGEYDHPNWWVGFPKEYQPQPMRAQNNPYQNHPRDRVSWYHAVAFTRWLNRQYRAAGLIGLGVELRLPTEHEWEYAARGTDGRQYPWGNGYRVGYANLNEQGGGVGPYFLNRTTAVGNYPQGKSPFDVLDMTGTLFEWCLNDHENPGTIEGYGNGQSKVLRGGSFFNSQYYAAASYRDADNPSYDRFNLGFRVVLSAPIASLASGSLVD